MNEEINGFGRAIELTENYAALQRWLITVADIARFPEEFQIFHAVDEGLRTNMICLHQ